MLQALFCVCGWVFHVIDFFFFLLAFLFAENKTKTVSTKFLIKGEFSLATPGAVQSLAFSKEYFGEDAIELVPSYLLLAQCYLGQKKFGQVQEYLGLANWSVLKTPDCNYEIRSQLHRTFGKLCAAQGKHNEATTHLAKDIYWMSLHKGPEHVATSTGYFHLATVFDAQHRVEAALALYDKVVDIWYKYLSTVRMAGEDAQETSEAQCEEALQMLTKILSVREQVLGEFHIATGEAQYTLGLLQLLMDRDLDTALSCIDSAHQVYTTHLGSDHPSTKDVEDILSLLNATKAQREGETSLEPQESAPITA